MDATLPSNSIGSEKAVAVSAGKTLHRNEINPFPQFSFSFHASPIAAVSFQTRQVGKATQRHSSLLLMLDFNHIPAHYNPAALGSPHRYVALRFNNSVEAGFLVSQQQRAA